MDRKLVIESIVNKLLNENKEITVPSIAVDARIIEAGESLLNDLTEAPLQVAKISSADAERRADQLRAMRASGQELPGSRLYSDPHRNAEQDPLAKPKVERMSFLKKAIDDGFVTNRMGEKKPIGPRIKQSMSDEISRIERDLGITSAPSERSQQAQNDLKSIFGSEHAVGGSSAFANLFKS